MATIYSIDSSLAPIRVMNSNNTAALFYRLTEDTPSHSELAEFDFQAGDSVEIDPFGKPTSQDVLMMQASDGTRILVSQQESAGFSRMNYVGIVVTHLRLWTDRRRTEHQGAQAQPQRSTTPLSTLAKHASLRLTLLLKSHGLFGNLQTAANGLLDRDRCGQVLAWPSSSQGTA